MENSTLTLHSASVNKYLQESNYTVQWEREMIAEILKLIKNEDAEKLAWYNSFGKDIRHILMNVHAYRKGLEFGFTEIAFDEHGWFRRPQFLNYEVLKFGSGDRYGEYSEIRIGRGVNGIWSYALSYSYGTAGGGSALSVYDPPFPSREAALTNALEKLKNLMTEKIGNSDTTNYKQAVILDTLKAVGNMQVSMVQLTLF